jgi:2-polyprenyl-3-methyl-5-hydroxy-6-metoxy-1,4-benzoquinol methylase
MMPDAADRALARTRCPLCGTDRATLEGRVEYEYIWRRLREVWNVEISEPMRRAHAPARHAVRVRCGSCGLERFEPMCPGNAEFYRELMATVPYNEQRWEFAMVRQRLSPAAAVVDLGCGDGSFLRSLGPRPGRTVGIDHHRPSIERLNAEGIEAFTVDFAVFADAEAARFDAATCFHVIEHVSDPPRVMRAARTCLRPGGKLFASVPNRERALRGADEPLDCPPHHVTRWAAEQLYALAARTGFRVERIHFEPPEFSVLRALARRSAAARLPFAPESVARLLYGIWAHARIGPRRYHRFVRSGRYEARRVFGHSMMAELSRDD